MPALRADLGDAVSKAFRATAFLAMAVAVGVVVGPALRAPTLAVDEARRVPVDRPDADDHAAARAATTAVEAHVVTLDRAAQEKSGIETASPAATTFQDQVRAYGTVLPLDRIVTLYNASLTNTAQMEAAKAKQADSRVANERAQTLYKAFATAKAQAQTAAATVEIETAGVATVAAQIEALRNSALQEWGPVLGPAIVERQPLAADLVRRKTRLVQLSLQPGAVVAAPQKLAFQLGDGPRVEGRLVSEAAQTDPKVQNLGYLYAVPAAAGLLPGTSVIAYLPKGDAQAGYDIPCSAVVWQAGRPWLYVRTAPDRFERRSIGEAAAPTFDGGYVVPAKRLAEGDGRTLVTAGAQVLLSQEMRIQIPTDGDD